MDSYIAAIRKKRSMEIWTVFIYLHQFMHHHMNVVKRIKQARRVKQRLIFFGLMTRVMVKSYLKRYQGLARKNLNEARYSISIHSYFTKSISKSLSKDMIWEFISHQDQIVRLIAKGLEFRNQILFYQKCLTNKLVNRQHISE